MGRIEAHKLPLDT